MTVFRYRAGILQWKESELEDVNRESGKTSTMYGTLHPRNNVDRLYIKRKDGGRRLMSVARCIREEDNSFGFYVANYVENRIREVTAAEAINIEDNVARKEFKN